jgi:two-component system sensor histidine kinase UhpB
MTSASTGASPSARARHQLPLIWQIFLPNLLVLAIVAGILAFSPAAISSHFSTVEAAEIAVALLLVALVNLFLIRRALRPLEQLTEVIASVDPLDPGHRAPVGSGSSETTKLAAAFNAMLERLETERRESGARMLTAQEQERVRLARELHDEIGQSVTGLMLEIDRVARAAPPGLEEDLRETQEAARGIGGELREIVRRLRPEALDDLGLPSALVALSERFSEQSSITVDRRFATGLPPLTAAGELAVYRIAQEALTNVAKHADANRSWLELRGHADAVELVVSDDGHGFNGAMPGNGIRGMRERAILVGAKLRMANTSSGGAEVRLTVPAKGVL